MRLRKSLGALKLKLVAIMSHTIRTWDGTGRKSKKRS